MGSRGGQREDRDRQWPRQQSGQAQVQDAGTTPEHEEDHPEEDDEGLEGDRGRFQRGPEPGRIPGADPDRSATFGQRGQAESLEEAHQRMGPFLGTIPEI